MNDSQIEYLYQLYQSLPSKGYGLWWLGRDGVLREIYNIKAHPEEENLCAFIKYEYGGGYVALDNSEYEDFAIVGFLGDIKQ